MKKRLVLIFIIIGIAISGCLNQSTPKTAGNDAETQVKSEAVTQTSISIEDQSIQFEEIKNRMNKLEDNISILQEKVNSIGILTPSKKQLIPQVPFKIEVKFADWQPATVYRFNENGFVDINSDLDVATYKIFKNNNTIKIESQKYDYYGLVIYDDYVASIYKSGWPDWVAKYTIIPSRINPETQKYELN